MMLEYKYNLKIFIKIRNFGAVIKNIGLNMVIKIYWRHS